MFLTAMIAGCSWGTAISVVPVSTGTSGAPATPVGPQRDTGACANGTSLLGFGGLGAQVPVASVALADGARLLSFHELQPQQNDLSVVSVVSVAPGQEPLIVRSLTGRGTHRVAPRAHAASGGWFLAGEVDGQLVLHGGQPDAFTVSGDGVIALAREDNASRLVWSRIVGAEGGATLTGVVALPDDSVMVAFTATRPPGLGVEMPPRGLSIGVLARFQPDGSTDWVQRLGGSTEIQIRSLVVDDLGRATVTGWIAGEGLAEFGAGQPGQVQVDPAGPEGFVAQYDPDGTLRWVTRATGGGAVADSVAVAPNGSVVAAGVFTIAMTLAPSHDTSVSVSTGAPFDGWVARLDEHGEVLWMDHTQGDRTTTVESRFVRVMGDSVVWVGNFGGTFTLGDDPWLRWPRSSANPFVVRFGLDGAYQCATRWVLQPSKDRQPFTADLVDANALSDQQLSLWGLVQGPVAAGDDQHEGDVPGDAMEILIDLP